MNQFRKTIAIAFTVFTMFLASNIYGQGPNVPEAAGFEPVDASDMVNLLTGDFTYVLPLLNVPSPEGGYPIALSYHAGIAMDQESSWVGLGWNINPGAINRSVNGYPDDWGKTSVNELFYDALWSEDYYDLGIGATIYGVDIGLGASWGSNKSLGGFVSVGAGFGGANSGLSAGVTLGTSGVGIYGSAGFKGMGGISVNASTNGIGVGYGLNSGSGAGMGVGLNWSPDTGVSGGISINQSLGNSKSVGMGINFSSNGISPNAKINGNQSGVSVDGGSISSGDYDINYSSNGFNLPLYFFYFNYGHTEVKYSLYKKNHLTLSGILYPYHANKTKLINSTSSYLLEENFFMDVKTIHPEFFSPTGNYLEDDFFIGSNNIILPNYDNYIVSAQGLSGSIKPSSFQELNLSARGQGEQIEADVNTAFVTKNFDVFVDQYYDIGAKTHFYFDNTYGSFLRINRGNIFKPPNVNTATEQTLLLFETVQDNTYSLDYTPDGELIMSNSRKREGNFVETFTNEQIKAGNVVGFIEAKGINRQSDIAFIDKGIGAYRITTTDGRTYHYSLPVYNFELFYKNFENENNENESFFELEKTKPYATHWLLTNITGPDYVDINNNGETDDEDYGYWVEFDYGKWSDGYAWKGPMDGYDVLKRDLHNDSYSYYWGRKQIYYLDAIKTRTHTALFVKEVRKDNMSSGGINVWNQKWISGNFDLDIYCKKFSSDKRIESVHMGGDLVYKPNGNSEILPTHSGVSPILRYDGKKGTARYVDIPKNKSMSLKQIILLKNDKLIETIESIKASGNLINTIQGHFLTNIFYHDIYYTPEVQGHPSYQYENGDRRYDNPLTIKTFDIHQHQNVLDISDIATLDLENKAERVINLDYDYSLATNTVNSSSVDKGRLTLKNILFKGKSGFALIPPYTFEYANSSTPYSKTLKDNWGYRKNNPKVWSLSKIITPTGGEIQIEHESDVTLSATGDELIFKLGNSQYTLTATNTDISNRICYIDSHETETSIEIGDNVTVRYDYFITPHEPMIHATVTGYIVEKMVGFDNKFKVSFTHNGGGYIDEITSVSTNTPLEFIGGGLRTKSISVSDEFGVVTKSEYNYDSPITGRTSGMSSYIPSKGFQHIPYVSELPSPGVLYGNVKLTNKDSNGRILGGSEYVFETIKPYNKGGDYLFTAGDAFGVKRNQTESFLNGAVNAKKYTIDNKLGNIGRLKSVIVYNGENQILRKKINNYKTNLEADGEIGVTQESFKSIKRVTFGGTVTTYNIVSSSKVNYPSVLESSTSIEGARSHTTYYRKHNFLTGQLMESESYMSNGINLKSQSTPAYKKYLEMGSKADNINNKNMLIQQALNYTFIDNNGSWKPIGVGISTWNNYWEYTNYDGSLNTPQNPNHKIWRKHRTFVWDGEINANGELLNYNIATDHNFDWNPSATQSSPWKQVSEITKYDHYSLPLEARDINNNYTVTKTTDDSSKVLLTCNAAFGDAFYSGAEFDYLDNSNFLEHLTLGANFRTLEKSHTGAYSVKINGGGTSVSNSTGFILLADQHGAGIYKLSAWVHRDNFSNARIKVGYQGQKEPFNGEKVYAGNWVLMNHYFERKENETNYSTAILIVSNSGELYVDDFRLHPIESSMTSYVYNDYDELTYVLGSNNLATLYQYDNAGRLMRIFQETINTSTITGGFKKVKEYKYNYKRSTDIGSGGGSGGGGGGNECELTVGLTERDINNLEEPSTAEFYAYGFAGGTISITALCSRENGPSWGDGHFKIMDGNNSVIEDFSLHTSSDPVSTSRTIDIPSSGLLKFSIQHSNHPRETNGYSKITIDSATPNTLCIDQSKNSFEDRDDTPFE